jgi:hypothetical protein
MAQKGFLSWVGFKSESAQPHEVASSVTPIHAMTSSATPTHNALDRIRELEAQVADLRARKDITSLTREEFEILATETAMNLVKTAQQREKSASSTAAKLLSESSTAANEAIVSAESKAKAILAAAEARGRKYLATAESEGNEFKSSAQRAAQALSEAAKREVEMLRKTTAAEVEALLSAKKREAQNITSTAKSEADALIEEAKSNIADYRDWLVSAVAESERLYKIQTQSLAAAQQAIDQSKQRLAHAFEKLAAHIDDVQENLDGENTPTSKEFARSSSSKSPDSAEGKNSTVQPSPVAKQKPVKKTAKKTPAKRANRASTTRGSKPGAKKAAKKSTRP